VTVIDELVAMFRIAPDNSGARAAEAMIERISRRTEELRMRQDQLAGAATLAAGVMAYGWWQANTEYESLRNSLDLVTGSAEGTAEAMAFLQEFATRSPDQLNQITQAYQMLRAQGLDPTAERLTALGDTAAAVQTDMASLVDALAGGVIGNTERLDEAFGRFGYNFSSRAGTLYVQVGDMNRRVGSSFEEISAFAEELGRTQFAGGMERQAATMQGAVSNLQDAITQAFVATGDDGLRGEVQALIREMADLVKVSTPAAKIFAGYLLMALRGVSSVLGTLSENTELVHAGMMALGALGTGAVLVGLINQVRSLGIYGAILAAEAAAVPLLVGAAVLGTVAILQDFGNWLSGDAPSVIGVFVDSFAGDDGPAGALAGMFVDFREHGAEAIALIVQDFESIRDAVMSIASQSAEWAQPLIDGVRALNAQFEQMRETLRNVVPDELKPVFDLITKGISFESTPFGALVTGGFGGAIGESVGMAGEVARGERSIMDLGRRLITGSTPAQQGQEQLLDADMMARSTAQRRVDRFAERLQPRMSSFFSSSPPPVQVSGTTLQVNIQTDGPVDADGLVERIRTALPTMMGDVFRTAFERAEAELE
jgi:hypothetical protein